MHKNQPQIHANFAIFSQFHRVWGEEKDSKLSDCKLVQNNKLIEHFLNANIRSE